MNIEWINTCWQESGIVRSWLFHFHCKTYDSLIWNSDHWEKTDGGSAVYEFVSGDDCEIWACCFNDGYEDLCMDMSEVECINNWAGTWHDGVPCSANPCA